MTKCPICRHLGTVVTLFVFRCTNRDCENYFPVRGRAFEQGVQQQGHKSESPDPDPINELIYYRGDTLAERLVRRHGFMKVSKWVSDAQYKIGQEEESTRRSQRETEIRGLEAQVRVGEEARRKLEAMK